MRVVKLGGSYAGSALLRRCLERIAEPGTVIVPGGGPFADTVRDTQPVMGFDDGAAHDMALMAMGQFGRALAALHPGIVPADALAAIRDALGAGRVPVWLPWPMLRGAAGIAASWDVTSDCLALWLAIALGAPYVLIVKHAEATGANAAMLLDRAFASLRERFPGTVRVVGPEGLDGAEGIAL
jgi:5-(aminomethyl)-3-furanmethanol phosphate kinase